MLREQATSKASGLRDLPKRVAVPQVCYTEQAEFAADVSRHRAARRSAVLSFYFLNFLQPQPPTVGWPVGWPAVCSNEKVSSGG